LVLYEDQEMAFGGLPKLARKLPNRDIRYTVAIGGKQDMTRTAQFGCE
jgi:hypothetical protein